MDDGITTNQKRIETIGSVRTAV